MEIEFITEFTSREDLLEQAVKANYIWHKAESENLGTFYDRMDLCQYSDWICKKAIDGDSKEFTFVPRIIIDFKSK